MDLNELTPEQKAKLLEQLEQEQREKKKKQQEQKEMFKDMSDEFVNVYFDKLRGVEDTLKEVKQEVFSEVEVLLSLKKEAYGMSDDAMERQQSHSISSADCKKTIILGHNVIDGWDADMAASGIDRVNKWLMSKMNDGNKELVEMIKDLLKPNKDGLLKANRVIELSNRAAKIGDASLIEAVSEIQSAYQPRKTTTFVKAKYKDANGQEVWLNLSMSNA
ncbi:MAG: DUF3164 family protein [Bacteroidales bacterium]|jgi:hypothetical protein|nr:DUF3164 family protein [Bacteroidales bacterium]